MKRQPTEWEKILVNDMSNKRLISTTYKKVIQLKIRKKQPDLKKKQPD